MNGKKARRFAWCVKAPHGALLPWAVGYLRTQAVDRFLIEEGECKTWGEFSKDGYQAVRVEIVESS